MTSRHHYNATHQQLPGQIPTRSGRHQTEGRQKIKSIFGASLPLNAPLGHVDGTESAREKEEDKEFSHKLDIYQQSFYTGSSNVRPPLFNVVGS